MSNKEWRKVVINDCFGGFGLSKEAIQRLKELGLSEETIDNLDYSRNRTNPLLVQVVEELGDKANGNCASLIVEEIPPNKRWKIHNYDGQETLIIEGEEDDWID